MSECVLDHLAKVSAHCLYARRQSNDYMTEVRAAVEKQWREVHWPAALAIAGERGAGKYTMVFETGHDIQRDELALLLPTELRQPYERGLVVVWWHPSSPTKYEITLNYESKRDLLLRQLAGEVPEAPKRARTDPAPGVAERILRLKSVPTSYGRSLMEQALPLLDCHDPAFTIVSPDDLAMAWERALLNQRGTEASDLFERTMTIAMAGFDPSPSVTDV